MNIGGGEAADQMVRMLLSGTEVVIRLSGSALKNLLALTLALARNHKKLSGKVNLGKMLRETRDLRQFSMTPEQYKEFQHRARKQKLLFATVRDRDGRGKLIDVILPVTELDRANQIFQRMLYQEPDRQPEAPTPERERTKERTSPEKGPQECQRHPKTPTARPHRAARAARRPHIRQICQKKSLGRDAARAIQEPAPLPPKAKKL